METPIKTAGVIGLGVMGFDIAFLYAGQLRTLAYDRPSMMDALTDRLSRPSSVCRTNPLSANEIDKLRTCSRRRRCNALAQAHLITAAVSEKAQINPRLYALRDAGSPACLQPTHRRTLATIARRNRQPRNFSLTHFFKSRAPTQDGRSRHATVRTDRQASYLSETLCRSGAGASNSGFVSNGSLMIYAVMAVRFT